MRVGKIDPGGAVSQAPRRSGGRGRARAKPGGCSVRRAHLARLSPQPRGALHSALAEALLFYARPRGPPRASSGPHWRARPMGPLRAGFSGFDRASIEPRRRARCGSFHALDAVVVGKDRPDLTLIMDIDADARTERADRSREVIRRSVADRADLGRPTTSSRAAISPSTKSSRGWFPQDRRRGAAPLRHHRCRRRGQRPSRKPSVGCRPAPACSPGVH